MNSLRLCESRSCDQPEWCERPFCKSEEPYSENDSFRWLNCELCRYLQAATVVGRGSQSRKTRDNKKHDAVPSRKNFWISSLTICATIEVCSNRVALFPNHGSRKLGDSSLLISGSPHLISSGPSITRGEHLLGSAKSPTRYTRRVRIPGTRVLDSMKSEEART